MIPHALPKQRSNGSKAFLEALGPLTRSLEKILENSLEGRPLGDDEALELFHATGLDLNALACVADRVKRRRVGDTATFVINRNINFTNECIVGCKFCGFYRSAKGEDVYRFTLEEIQQKTLEAKALGATEVCIQGGLPKSFEGFFYRDILRAVKQSAPEMHIHAFSPMEVLYGSQLTGMGFEDFLRMLKDEGLGSMPGTAAEVFDESVRALISKNKLPLELWAEIVKTAHGLGIPTTSTIMYGHIETPSDIVAHMRAIRDIQKETGGITEFVPLGFIYPNTKLHAEGKVKSGPSGLLDLKVHAIARLYFQGTIDHIQASWVKVGPKLAQVLLLAGADDFGGTLMEEHIAKAAGGMEGQYVPPETFISLIRELGLTPIQRSTIYKPVKVYQKEAGA
jgi:FO synthase